jgi:NADP-dependent 3-hydroxy acid dehydrogenase YdfG
VTSGNWNNTIAITGAGSGFGAALAHKYAADGWKVAVTDIDEDRARQTLFEIQQLGGDGFSLLLDTTNSDHWQQLENEIRQRWGGLQILVNNAGVATAGNVEDTSMEDWQWVLDIDLMGVVRGCRQFAGMFKRQRSGHIVNIASFAGLAGLPFVASYGVAKAGVVALSEALRVEMHEYGVGVTVACPAFVKTNLLDTFRATNADTKSTVTRWMENSGISAEHIAEAIAAAVINKKLLLLTHPQTRSGWRMKRWFPERYFKALTKHQGP